jgi:hypothetical protein
MKKKIDESKLDEDLLADLRELGEIEGLAFVLTEEASTECGWNNPEGWGPDPDQMNAWAAVRRLLQQLLAAVERSSIEVWGVDEDGNDWVAEIVLSE